MAEAGNEHRIIDRRRYRVAPAGQQCGRDGALVALQRGTDPRIDRIAQALHERRIAQPPAAAGRRLRGLDRTHDKTGGADAGEEHVAAEIVTAGPQRRQWRQQPRLQLDETADVGRGALLDRQPYPLQLDRAPRAVHGRNPQDKAIGTFADVAGLDKARERHRKHRPRQHAMADPRGFPGRHRKAGRKRCDHHRDWKDLVPPQQERRHAERDGEGGHDRQHRLMIGGEVKRDAGAERDRHPWQQTPGAGFGANPLPQGLDQRRPYRETRGHEATGRRCGARRPRPGIASPAARRGALLRHHATLRYSCSRKATGRCGPRASGTDEEYRGKKRPSS